MTHLPQTPDIKYLLGNGAITAQPLAPFDQEVCDFLADLSSELQKEPESRDYPDVLTFAFWCRTANINRIKNQYLDNRQRLGVGLLFHIAPSNVPVNFAYTFVFGLLAGNANIVRVPTRDMPQVDIICAVMTRLLVKDKYERLREMTSFVRYAQNAQITGALSSMCQGRVIWGGDQAITEIRKSPLAPRSVELTFSDRYSISVINPYEVEKLSDEQTLRLAENFYNDTYLMDQNACSSPHLVIWLCSAPSSDHARDRFWTAVENAVTRRYNMAAIQAVDKYTMLLDAATRDPNLKYVKQYRNSVYTIGLSHLPETVEHLRGRYGLFYEIDMTDLNLLAPLVTTKFQTLTYFGVDKGELQRFVVDNRLLGIDRIVPIGRALDIDVIWDGRDIIRTLSRIVDVS